MVAAPPIAQRPARVRPASLGNYDRHGNSFVLNIACAHRQAVHPPGGSTVNSDSLHKNQYGKAMNEDRQSLDWQTRLVPARTPDLDLSLL